MLEQNICTSGSPLACVLSLTDQRSTSEILLTYLDIPVESWTKAAEQFPLGRFRYF